MHEEKIISEDKSDIKNTTIANKIKNHTLVGSGTGAVVGAVVGGFTGGLAGVASGFAVWACIGAVAGCVAGVVDSYSQDDGEIKTVAKVGLQCIGYLFCTLGEKVFDAITTVSNAVKNGGVSLTDKIRNEGMSVSKFTLGLLGYGMWGAFSVVSGISSFAGTAFESAKLNVAPDGFLDTEEKELQQKAFTQRLKERFTSNENQEQEMGLIRSN